jgi:hypothetical protein
MRILRTLLRFTLAHALLATFTQHLDLPADPLLTGLLVAWVSADRCDHPSDPRPTDGHEGGAKPARPPRTVALPSPALLAATAAAANTDPLAESPDTGSCEGR